MAATVSILVCGAEGVHFRGYSFGVGCQC